MKNQTPGRRFLHLITAVAAALAVFTGAGALAGDYESKRNSGEVMFKLTPQGVEGGRFIVKVKVDTHSGNLADLNLQKALTLKVGEESYSPLENVRLGGHHSTGKLEFDLAEPPSAFEIIITGVRAMANIVLKWP